MRRNFYQNKTKIETDTRVKPQRTVKLKWSKNVEINHNIDQECRLACSAVRKSVTVEIFENPRSQEKANMLYYCMYRKMLSSKEFSTQWKIVGSLRPPAYSMQLQNGPVLVSK